MSALGTIRIFCGYLLLLGAGGMLVPNVLLRALGFPPTTEVWVRVAAMLVFNYGLLYIWIIRARAIAIIRYTIVARILVFFYLGAFALAGLAPARIMIFGVLDAAGGVWTWWALNRDARSAWSSEPARSPASEFSR